MAGDILKLAAIVGGLYLMKDTAKSVSIPTREALANPNVQAFLAMIRHYESRGDYNALVYGGRFDDMSTHPRILRQPPRAGLPPSTAAGAYQFLARTYDWLHSVGVMPDMTPASQDAGAVFLLKSTGALARIVAGDFAGAVNKARLTWASLPGSPYGQPTAQYSAALAQYTQAGGTVA